MRSISCALISFVCFYMAKHIIPNSGKDRAVNGFFALLSWMFLVISVVFMIIGM